MTRETTDERNAREALAVRDLFDEVRAALPTHSAVVMAEGAGQKPWFVARCRCGWSGTRRKPFSVDRVLHVKRLCALEAAAHEVHPEGVPVDDD